MRFQGCAPDGAEAAGAGGRGVKRPPGGAAHGVFTLRMRASGVVSRSAVFPL